MPEKEGAKFSRQVLFHSTPAVDLSIMPIVGKWMQEAEAWYLRLFYARHSKSRTFFC